MLVKKTEKADFSEAERRRYEDIVQIQTLLADGYAPVQIKELLGTTYSRIRRYATGDPLRLCRFQGEREPEANQYRDVIVSLIGQNMSLKHMHEHVSALGYKGKRTAFGDYCRKLVAESGVPYMPRRNTAGVPIDPSHMKPAQRTVSKNDVLRHLWSGIELAKEDLNFIYSKYTKVGEIERCIKDFRKIYKDNDVTLLDNFLTRYSESPSKPIKSFAIGLRGDLDAVKNSVTSEFSNGFVEGINNKIKAIKRVMYGRAKIDLLRVKVLYAR